MGKQKYYEVKKIPSSCAPSSSPYVGINAAIEQVSVTKNWEDPEQLPTAVMTDRSRERPSTHANMCICVMTSKWLGHEKLSLSHDFAESYGQVSQWLPSAGGFSTRSEVLSLPSLLSALQAGTVHGKVLPSVTCYFRGEVGKPGLRLNKETQHHHTQPLSPPLCFWQTKGFSFLSQTVHRISLWNVRHDEFLKGSKPCNKGVSFNESGGWQGSREAIVGFG